MPFVATLVSDDEDDLMASRMIETTRKDAPCSDSAVPLLSRGLSTSVSMENQRKNVVKAFYGKGPQVRCLMPSVPVDADDNATLKYTPTCQPILHWSLDRSFHKQQ